MAYTVAIPCLHVEITDLLRRGVEERYIVDEINKFFDDKFGPDAKSRVWVTTYPLVIPGTY